MISDAEVHAEHALLTTTTELIDMRSSLLSARAAALFASDLPTGSKPNNAAVRAAVAATVRARGGTRGCVATMATAYGDCPEIAAPRMRWALCVLTAQETTTPSPERAPIAA